MKKQAFQHAELRDENDNIVQSGSYGKLTAFSNASNDGAFDYIMNNLEALNDSISSESGEVSNNAVNTGSLTVTGQSSIADATATSVNTGSLTVTGQSSAVTADTSDSSTKIATTQFIKQVLSENYHSMYPVGHIITSINSANPNTYLPYMSDTTWTQVGAGRVLQAVSSSQTAGSTLNAGLPNITGTFSTTPAVIGGYDIATGALKRTTQDALTSEGYTKGGTFSPLGDVVLTFNAANSNSIYGASSTVQPPALLVYFWERTA